MAQFDRIEIFDLDGTVIDSSHRQLQDKNGILDLDHWRANCTPEMVAKDSLMPLASFWKSLHGTAAMIVVCTARVMQNADFKFLQDNGLNAHKIFSRNLGDTRPVATLKRVQLNPFINLIQNRDLPKRMFEDDLSVHETLKPLGITMVNPKEIMWPNLG